MVGLKPLTIDVLGGNQSDAVNVKTFPRADVLGYRWPVKATVKELREAGRSEIKVTDVIKVGSGVTAVGGAVAQVAESTSITDQIKDIGTHVEAATVIALVEQELGEIGSHPGR